MDVCNADKEPVAQVFSGRHPLEGSSEPVGTRQDAKKKRINAGQKSTAETPGRKLSLVQQQSLIPFNLFDFCLLSL